jgi:hypothetical protein
LFGHVVHAVGPVRPRLYHHRGSHGKLEGRNLLLDARVGHARQLGLAHVVAIDVRVAAVQFFLRDDGLLAEVDLVLGEGVIDVSLNSGKARWWGWCLVSSVLHV